MSYMSFLIASGAFFVADMVVLTVCYLFFSRKNFMVLDTEKDLNVFPRAFPIQLLLLTAGAALLMHMNGFLMKKYVLTAFGAGILTAASSVPFSNRRAVGIGLSVFRFAVFAALVFLSPEDPPFIATLPYPPVAVKLVLALIWTLVFEKIAKTTGDTSLLFLGQMLYVGGVMFAAVFLTIVPLFFCQTGSILLFAALALLPFPIVMGAALPASPLFFGAVSFFITVLAWMMTVSGHWATAVILLSFYFTDAVYGLVVFFKNLFRREKFPLVLSDRFKMMGATDYQIFSVVFRREALFGAMTLFALRFPESQVKLLMITALLYLKFMLNIFSPALQKTSYGQLFRQIKDDVKKNIKDAAQTVEDFKNRKNNK